MTKTNDDLNVSSYGVGEHNRDEEILQMADKKYYKKWKAKEHFQMQL